MSKLRLKNFGPIKEGFKDANGEEWMDIKKVTVFIGNQGSGKSTVAKVISTLTWMEKAFNRGDLKNNLSKSDFWGIFKYQRIANYFNNETEINYIGETITIIYNKENLYPIIKLHEIGNYLVPKIMYVPAERNFLTVVKNAYGIKNLPDTLYTFAEELQKGQLDLKDKKLDLPIGGMKFRFNQNDETSYLIGEDFELDMTETSSGYQSFVPLYLVTKFLTDELSKGENVLREQLSVKQSVRRNKEISDLMFNNTISAKEKENKLKKIDAKYLNRCFINIVEEPEQNLFPTSQHEILNCLLEFNNMIEGNKLIMTTHSPYLINYLTLAVEANGIKQKITSQEFEDKLKKIVPLDSTILSGDLLVYELNELDGSIKLLENYKGLPSDENKLNNELGEGNESFAKLLELEQKL